jgi:asparagine synthase (glutamine-hydrolysing)
MCGIAGVVGTPTPRAPKDVAAVRRMNDALTHRGPDAEGIWQRGRGVLGHRRLSIIDLSPEANQPLLSEDGSIGAVVNGEIYNYRELRDDLEARGHTFRSQSDSEVVVHLYEDLGTSFVDKLSGMFAVAIWDAARERLVLARDRAGKKPLYYRCLPGGGVAFASEVHALLAGFPDLEARPNFAAIDEYLTLQYVPSPHTAYEGIRKLEAAHVAVLERGGAFRTTCYWHKPDGVELEGNAEDLARELRTRLERAVRRRLVADVPLGAFLSGGIDSSVVVALMARATGRRIKTFSMGFPDAADSELPFARLVALRYGTDHHEEVLPPDIEDIALASVRHHGEPFGDSSAVATFCLARMARRHATVALSGDASDEMFAGYTRYEAARLAHAYDALPPPLRRVYGGALSMVTRALFPHAAGYFEHLGDGEAVRYPYLMCQFTSEEKEALLEPQMRAATTGATVERFERILAASGRRSAMGRLVDLDASTYLVDDINVKVDRASMANSLEVRCPFLDVDLVELAARLPGSMLMRVRGKHLLRRAVRDLVPRPVLLRKKRGFGLPLRRWMRGPLANLVKDTLLDGTARARGLFRPREVERLVSRVGVDKNAPDRVWTLLMLELWFRQFIDRRAAATVSGAA